ncbi:MAG: ATP-binding cassette domain-containing protein [Leptospiraceae bacterium]|nr:ATP-binding cassette domain-containing protein [Leptospiraceae bacterium]
MIEITEISKNFTLYSGLIPRRRHTLRALIQVSLKIKEGEIVGLVGESGSGKSTLARILMGLYRPDAGYFKFGAFDSRQMTAKDWRELRRNLGVVFQDPASSMNPWLTVGQIVAEPLTIRKRELGLSKQKQRDLVAEMLEATGIPATAMDRRIHEFSGGQRQRIAIARALILKPSFLILDEPISALDVSVQAQILNLLRDLHARHRFAALFITHDLAKVAWFADRVAVMYLGRIVEQAPAETIFKNPSHPYTQALALSRLDISHTQRDFFTLPGEIPSPLAEIAGCAFAPRCVRAIAICQQDFPPRTAKDDKEFFCYNPIRHEN